MNIIVGIEDIAQKYANQIGTENIYAFCDYKGDYLDKSIGGLPVISLKELTEIWEKYQVVLAVPGSRKGEEARKKLAEAGVSYSYYLGDDEERLFKNVYKNKLWGEDERKHETQYYSGAGSHDERIIVPYINLLRQLIINNGIRSIFEVGCGDFNIMRQVLENMDDVTYIGGDIVPELVEQNNRRYAQKNIQFIHINGARDTKQYAGGDLLIFRQVFQHNSNRNIEVMLKQSKKYKYTLVTEDVYINEGVEYNIDMHTSASTRVEMKSGVYIDKPPFNVQNSVNLLTVPREISEIRTTLIISNAT
ncbi:MAG: class I SAM-dependent methyltransferase [Lachnospiraceae bacterium]|nr:class I SAM-dependent methyltransferase [Lachnospiraceae bacterium]